MKNEDYHAEMGAYFSDAALDEQQQEMEYQLQYEDEIIYDYSQCGDVELELYEVNLRNAQSSLQARKEFLKTIPTTGIDIIAPYSGEVVKIFPPSKSSTK